MRQSPARSATKLGRLRRNLIILGVLFGMIVVAGSSVSILRTRRVAVEYAERNVQNLVTALQEHASSVFRAADVVLSDDVIYFERRGRAAPFDEQAWHSFLAAQIALLPQLRNIGLIDAHGRQIAEARNFPATAIDATDRVFFKTHRDDPSNTLLIGTPVKSRLEGDWVIPVSRRLNKADGSFGGVVVAIIAPRYFNEFYKSLDIGSDGTVWIFNQDRELLVREPYREALYEEGYRAKTIGDALDRAPSGTFIAPSPVDGVERMMSYRSVPDIPIIVAIGVRMDEALAIWRRQSSHRAIAAAAVLSLIGALILALIRNLAAAQREQAAQSRLYGAIEGLSEAIVLYDAQERFVLCNSRHRELHPETVDLHKPGTTQEELLRASVERGQIRLPPGIDGETHVRTRMRQFRNPGGEPIAPQLVSGRWLQISERRTPDGGVIRIATDITALKQHEDELTKAKEAAEASSRTKSVFLANMSHELRTPLHAILGLSEIIRDQPANTDAPTRDYGKMIHDSGQHLLQLINDILDMSKIEAGRYELVEEVLSLSDIVGACLSITSSRARAAGVSVVGDVNPLLPSIRADRRAMKQVLLNLLSNAVKFTPAGGRVTVSAEIDADGSLACHVTDTGVGIASENLDRVAEPFWQADPSHARKYGGTGLGLSISKRLMELHGGTLEISSTVGRGTTVIVRLPSRRVVAADV